MEEEKKPDEEAQVVSPPPQSRGHRSEKVVGNEPTSMFKKKRMQWKKNK